jgi:hypothetical protein
MLLGFTGIGSTLFHLTNRYWAQVLGTPINHTYDSIERERERASERERERESEREREREGERGPFEMMVHFPPLSIDELPMLYFNLVTSINLLESNTRLPQHRWLPAVMWTAAAAITLVYMFLPEFYALFLTTYSGLVVILILLSFKRVYFQVFPMLVADSESETAKSALRRCRLLLWSAFFFYVCSGSTA